MLLKSMSLRNKAKQLLKVHETHNDLPHTNRRVIVGDSTRLGQMHLPVQIIVNLANNRTA